MKRIVIAGTALVLLLLAAAGVIVLRGLSDFELKGADVSTLAFRAGDADLVGTLALPARAPDAPIVLLVHGDGPRTRFSDDAMLPLVNSLLDAGIGVFAWDKQGTGRSGGDWLAQSMQDRANETIAAMTRVRAAVGPAPKIGLLGFSQGGWVIPRVANTVRPAFSVIVGGAVSWRRQGTYLTRQQLQATGLQPDRIDATLAAERRDNDAIFGQADVPADPRRRPDIEPRRFGFIARNYLEDASQALATMQGPVLAVWGAQDRNVDPLDEANTYTHAFANQPDRRVAIVPDATHALLRAGWFDYQLESDWPTWKQWLYMALGRHAYAPDTLGPIEAWIRAQ
ncbi:alpha/beta hydrolase family protein [Burkholderia lata]|uniref:Peptidase n=1 Tax=Burkholderia lata (strain ATCC 17760 / DSM 23089 / LMG 22485 / NCIMB 9086 / R18194 / 383) TaxID=482957 RepID=A0A6P2R2J3_BURL3|nr:alpha/beta hydrolase [Burkholderia lata]VWB78057.1 peptidase [Burkholderia lata]VWC29164.1 peptidase [Burkholderia lata]